MKFSTPNRWGLITIALILISVNVSAQIVRNFTSRYSTNETGDLQIIGNSSLTCPGAAAGCTSAQSGIGSGAALNNNNYTMGNINVDPTGHFNSSQATFTLPTGATVLWAGLYWGADTSAGTSGSAAPTAASKNQVLFSTPTSGGYSAITATQVDVSGNRYQGFAVVTSLAQSTGTYTVANIQAGTGQDRHAGWALVLVYRDSSQPARNLTVFDGFGVVNTTNNSMTMTVTGFTTPPSGTVRTNVGAVAYEGDLGSTGDNIKLNGTTLTDALNPSGNFFNSTITRLGSYTTGRNPSYINNLGFDIDVVNADGIITNGSVSATINLTTNTETYFPGVVTFTNELYAPQVNGNVTKTVTDVNGGTLMPGDILEYNITATNIGVDGAVGIVLTDTIPANTTYVANSLEITSGANTGTKTDTTGDDQLEYDSGLNRIVGRLGTGANGTTGGALATSASNALKFRVQVNSGVAANTVISNQAVLNYNGLTLGFSYTAYSDGDTLTVGDQPTTITVTIPDLTISKAHTGNFAQGQTGATYTLTVNNTGTGASNGTVTVTDTVPTGLTPTAASGTGWTCNIVGQDVTCTRTDALAASTSFPVITLTVDVAANAAASITNAASVSGGGEINTGNNSINDPTTIGVLPQGFKSVKLTTDTDSSSSITPGDVLTYKIQYANTGTASFTSFQVNDVLPSGVTKSGALSISVSGAGTSASANLAYTGAVSGILSNTLASGATLAPSGLIQIDIPVTVNLAYSGTLSNQASASAASNSVTVLSDNVDATTTGLPSGVTVPSGSVTQTQTSAIEPTTTTVAGAGVPNITLLKSVSPTGQQIPGTDLSYTIQFTNDGAGSAQRLVIADIVPTNTDFKIGSATTSAGTSGLTITIEYSNNSGTSWAYTPVSGGGGATTGYDRAVTNIRWRVTSGDLSQIAPNNTANVGFTAKIR